MRQLGRVILGRNPNNLERVSKSQRCQAPSLECDAHLVHFRRRSQFNHISDIEMKKEKPLTSRNSKRFAASGRVAVWVLVGILLLGPGLTARAQSEGDNWQRGLEGAWRLQLTVRDCNTGQALRTFPAVFTFAKEGTATLITAGQLPSLATPGLGTWRHAQGHNYSAVTDVFVFSPAGVWTQTHRLTRAIEVSIDGDAFTDTVALEIFDTNGNLIVTGCATSVATRFK
jgi:hypothetical protein